MGGWEGKDGMAKRGRKRKIWPLLLAALVLFALWENRSVQVEEFAFASERLPEGLTGLRIAQLSDLHGAEFGRDNARLLAAVAGAEPHTAEKMALETMLARPKLQGSFFSRRLRTSYISAATLELARNSAMMMKSGIMMVVGLVHWL